MVSALHCKPICLCAGVPVCAGNLCVTVSVLSNECLLYMQVSLSSTHKIIVHLLAFIKVNI